MCHASRPAWTSLFVVTFAFNEGQQYEAIITPGHVKACYAFHHYMLCVFYVSEPNWEGVLYTLCLCCMQFAVLVDLAGWCSSEAVHLYLRGRHFAYRLRMIIVIYEIFVDFTLFSPIPGSIFQVLPQ
jgi:hypothetical protein